MAKQGARWRPLSNFDTYCASFAWSKGRIRGLTDCRGIPQIGLYQPTL